jgi:hypothetical protein
VLLAGAVFIHHKYLMIKINNFLRAAAARGFLLDLPLPGNWLYLSLPGIWKTRLQAQAL